MREKLREGKKRKRKEKREGPKRKKRDQTERWKGLFGKNRKQRRVAARCRGWERKTARGKP